MPPCQRSDQIYKIVHIDRYGRLKSLRTNLIYTPNTWVKPEIPGSKLFVFKYLEDAISFYYFSSTPKQIYTCLVGTRQWQAQALTYFGELSADSIQRFWEFPDQLRAGAAPVGTMVTSKVMLKDYVDLEMLPLDSVDISRLDTRAFGWYNRRTHNK